MNQRVPARGATLSHEVRGTDETVLFDEAGNQLLVLNEIGAAIWLLVDNHRSIGDITDIVVETLDAPTEQVSMDVIAFLEDLEGKGLISWQ